jgi:transposase-like protein
LKPTTDSWRVDETYIKVKKEWVYLYRAVDSQGNTLDFLFSPTRDAKAAKQFFLQILAASHTSEPRVINVDKNAAYPKAFNELKVEGYLSENCEALSTALTITPEPSTMACSNIMRVRVAIKAS